MAARYFDIVPAGYAFTPAQIRSMHDAYRRAGTLRVVWTDPESKRQFLLEPASGQRRAA